MNNNKTYLKVYYAINTKIIQIYRSIYLSIYPLLFIWAYYLVYQYGFSISIREFYIM